MSHDIIGLFSNIALKETMIKAVDFLISKKYILKILKGDLQLLESAAFETDFTFMERIYDKIHRTTI